MRFTLLFLLLFTIAVSANPDITSQEIHDHIAFLAADSLKGRLPGSPEGRQAADYIRHEFEMSGLQLLADQGFQSFEIVTELEPGDGNRLTFGDSLYTPGEDMLPLSFSANDSLTAPVVFCGYGFDIRDSLTWNDYKDVDVSDKWALLLYGDPEPDDLNSVFARHADIRKKCIIARDHGAVGVLITPGPKFDTEDELPELLVRESHITLDLPVVHLRRPVAKRTAGRPRRRGLARSATEPRTAAVQFCAQYRDECRDRSAPQPQPHAECGRYAAGGGS
ncbi:MAG: hypothetical protein U5R06_17255 [candidate division KSB1 bacterium]|nr:hypothetical protein [candidate division KSB1 bacterium]